MKNLKKLAALALAVILCFALASCGGVVPSSYLEVDPATGAGKASFSMMVPKNGVNGIGNNFYEPNDGEPNDQGYITSPDALLTLLKSKVPSGFTVTMKEETKMAEVKDDQTGETSTKDQGNFTYTVSFSFSSIADYNAKIEKWLPAKYWDLAKTALNVEINKTAMTSTGDANNATVTLTSDAHILDVMCQWAYDITTNDTTGAFVRRNQDHEYQYQYFYTMDDGTYTVKFNGKETVKKYNAVDGAVKVEATGIDTTATSNPTPNPSTGDPIAVSAIVVTALAAGALLIARKRSK